MSGATLEGRGILVTRPAAQAGRLTELLRAAGAEPVLFPVLEILDARDLAPLTDLIDRLESFDWAIFISPTAVDKAMNLIAARRSLPQTLRIAAIGRGSSRELARHGVGDVLVPQGRFDSEALLDLAELRDMAGRRVVIFRGDGGRELLGDALVARGATVQYAECYRRARPRVDAGPLLRRWARGEIDAVTVTSGEGLRNLFDLVGKLGQQWLRRTPLAVSHPRIGAVARELGIASVIEADGADEALVQALAAHFASDAAS